MTPEHMKTTPEDIDLDRMKDDTISRQAVLKLLSTMPPEEATTKALLIQSVKQMDAVQPDEEKISDTLYNIYRNNKPAYIGGWCGGCQVLHPRDLPRDIRRGGAEMDEKIVKDSQCLVNDLANDCISRKAAIDAVMRNACNTQRIYEAIKGLPSAQPETHDKRTETHTCDLISRQAAIEAIDRYYKDKRYITRSRTILSAICRDMKSTMDSLPSAQSEQRLDERTALKHMVADAPTIEQPEIIYCRECRHWYTGDGYNHENGAQCALTHMWMGPDDYCSYGRRKVSE